MTADEAPNETIEEPEDGTDVTWSPSDIEVFGHPEAGDHVLLRKPGAPKAKKSTYAVARKDTATGVLTVLTSWTTKKRALAEWSAKK